MLTVMVYTVVYISNKFQESVVDFRPIWQNMETDYCLESRKKYIKNYETHQSDLQNGWLQLELGDM